MAKKELLNRLRRAGCIPEYVPQPVKIAKPIGNVVMISRVGARRKMHYSAFEFDEDIYNLGDTVLLAPDSQGQTMKPYVARIKDITKMENKGIMVHAQWFYRPQDATPRNGKNMSSLGARELYYSFHKDEVPAETIMHKCTVHFVTAQNHIPARKEYPGFIVLKVYDPNSKRLLKFTNNDFLHDMQQEIDLLVQNTMRHLKILVDNESEDGVVERDDHAKINMNA